MSLPSFSQTNSPWNSSAVSRVCIRLLSPIEASQAVGRVGDIASAVVIVIVTQCGHKPDVWRCRLAGHVRSGGRRAKNLNFGSIFIERGRPVAATNLLLLVLASPEIFMHCVRPLIGHGVEVSGEAARSVVVVAFGHERTATDVLTAILVSSRRNHRIIGRTRRWHILMTQDG